MPRSAFVCGAQMDDLELLVFTVAGIIIGVDTEQVAGMLSTERAEEVGMEVSRFHEKIPLGGRSVHYRSPKALLIKDETPYAVIIELPDDILSVSLDSIRPLPLLLQTYTSCQAIWGVAVKEERIIVLVDFLRLHAARERGRESRPDSQ
ncbi:MAG: hypothetical protein ABSA46_14865 [Thermodesulfovibrionales bacterium]